MPAASTSALYSRIARKYHHNDTRDLKGLRLKPKKVKAPALPKITEPPATLSGGKGLGPLPKKPGHHANLAQMGLEVTAGIDPLWSRQFLMRGSDIVVYTGPWPDTKSSRKCREMLTDDYLASMTLYALPPAFYEA